MIRTLSILLLYFLSTSFSDAQFNFPNLSPHTHLKQQVGYTNIELRYDRPAARGRKIFGGLVPYDKIWRTGAAEATTLSFDQAVEIEGKKVKAGTYALFTIPHEDYWELILNSDADQYGAYGHNPKLDILRVTAPTQTLNDFQESLTLSFDFIPNDAILSIVWAKTKVAFKISTGTNEEVSHFIKDSLLTELSLDSDLYANGASFMLTHHQSLDTALVLANKSLAMNETEYGHHTKMKILRLLGRNDEANKEINAALSFIRNHPHYSENDKKISTQEWVKELEKENTN